MADAYATLANGGVHHDPTAISRVEFPNGKVDEFDSGEGERVLTPGQAWEVTKLLEGVITARHRRRLHLDRLHLGGRQDRNLRGRVRRLVRRLHADVLDRGLGRAPDSRANTPASADPPPARSGRTTCRPRRKANCPEFEVPSSLPELSALVAPNTPGPPRKRATKEEESEEPEEEEKEKKKQEKEEKSEEGEEGRRGRTAPKNPAPEPRRTDADAQPTPPAQPPCDRRRRQPRLSSRSDAPDGGHPSRFTAGPLRLAR